MEDGGVSTHPRRSPGQGTDDHRPPSGGRRGVRATGIVIAAEGWKFGGRVTTARLRRELVVACAALGLLLASAIPALGQPIRYGHTWGTSKFEAALAIEVDDLGNVYLAGIWFDPATFTYLGFVAKLDPFGSLVWDRTIAVGNSSVIYDMAWDGSGRLFLFGARFAPGAPYPEGSFLASMTTDGDLLFVEDLPGIAFPARIVPDPATGGSVLLGADPFGAAGTVAAFDASGGLRWSRSTDGNETIPLGIAVDGAGTVHVLLARDYQDVGIASLDTQGRLLRGKRLAMAPYQAFPRDLALAPDGSLLAMADIYDPLTYRTDLFVMRASDSLEMLWHEIVASPSL